MVYLAVGYEALKHHSVKLGVNSQLSRTELVVFNLGYTVGLQSDFANLRPVSDWLVCCHYCPLCFT